MPKAPNAQGTPTCAPHPANGVRNGQPTGQDAMPVTTTAAGADRGYGGESQSDPNAARVVLCACSYKEGKLTNPQGKQTYS